MFSKFVRDRFMLALRKKDMKQAELAKQLGMDNSQLSRILNHPESRQLKTLTRIAGALDVDLSEILRGLRLKP